MLWPYPGSAIVISRRWIRRETSGRANERRSPRCAGALAIVPPRDALHLLQEVVQSLIRRIGHLGEGAQKAVGTRQLKQCLVAVLRSRGADQHDVVERLQHQLLER